MIEVKLQFSSMLELKNFVDQMTNSSVEVHSSISEPFVEPLRKNKLWTQFELDYLVSNYYKFKAKAIAKSLQRPTTAVRSKINQLLTRGLLKKKNRCAGKAKEL